MIYYWFRFKTLKPVCVEVAGDQYRIHAGAEEAARVHLTADEQAQVSSVGTLPYPATPVRNATKNSCPPFCYKPDQCKGRTACPQNYACSE